MCTNDPADTGEVKKEISREKVDSSALRAAEIKKKTGWHRDEIAPANLLHRMNSEGLFCTLLIKKT